MYTNLLSIITSGQDNQFKSPVNPPTVNDSQIKTAPNIGTLQVRGDVKFNLGSAQLTNEGKQTLNQLAQEISERLLR